MVGGVAAIMRMRVAVETRGKYLIIDRRPSGASDFVGPAGDTFISIALSQHPGKKKTLLLIAALFKVTLHAKRVPVGVIAHYRWSLGKGRLHKLLDAAGKCGCW